MTSRTTRPRAFLEADETVVWRSLVTPDGVELDFALAGAAERILAYGLDLVILGGAIGALWMLSGRIHLLSTATPWFLGLLILATFVGWNSYFIGFENRWQGRTPGKRWQRLRVVDAGGGQLTSEAIFARNLTRDLEVFLPLLTLILPDLAWPAAPAWLRLLASGWLLVFLLMPLLNRDRQRVGDLVAGTLVVRNPRHALLDDLTGDEDPEAGSQHPTFSERQLGIYGIYELQVLEGILRREDTPGNRQVRSEVCRQICRKIGFDQPIRSEEDFLTAFYAALREHLERRLLFGRRREDKTSGVS